MESFFSLMWVSHRHWIGFAVLSVVLIAGVRRVNGSESKNQPNVVILYTDDQGSLDVNCYGAPDLHTPNMDRLAESGIRFTQAYAHTVCCPSRAALLTGRHPRRSGVGEWTQVSPWEKRGSNMALEEVTLAEALHNAGYQTALFGKWHLGADLDHGPLSQGFDEFFGFRGGFVHNTHHYFLHGAGFHDLWDGSEEIYREGDYFPEMITARALNFLEKNRNDPFFLYLSFNSPHYPMNPRPEDFEGYEQLEEPRRSYAAFVTTTDHYIGKVLDQLESLGLRENTIVVFQSDNGHEYTSHQRIKTADHLSGLPEGYDYGPGGDAGYTGKWIGHKYDLYEGGIRTPAILSYPAKIKGNQKRDQLITVMDWFPTLLDLCGIQHSGPPFDGKNLVSLLNDSNLPSPHKVVHYQWYHSWMVREEDWKLYYRVESGKSEDAGTLMLLNITDDPPERKNYLEEKPDLAEHLKALHLAWEKEVSNWER